MNFNEIVGVNIVLHKRKTKIKKSNSFDLEKHQYSRVKFICNNKSPINILKILKSKEKRKNYKIRITFKVLIFLSKII